MIGVSNNIQVFISPSVTRFVHDFCVMIFLFPMGTPIFFHTVVVVVVVVVVEEELNSQFAWGVSDL